MLASALALAAACGDSESGVPPSAAGSGGASAKGGTGQSGGGLDSGGVAGAQSAGGAPEGAGMPHGGMGEAPGGAGGSAGEGLAGSADAGQGGEALGGQPGGSGAGGDSSIAGAVSDGGSGGEPGEPEPACPKPEGEICHELFASDNGRNQVLYVNEFEPAKNWTKPVNDTTVNSPRQLQLVDNAASSNGKAVLVSVNKGYQEYDMVSGARLVNVVLAATTGVRGATRLPSGNTLLGVGDNKLRVVDNTGSTVGVECTLPGSGADSLRTIVRNSETGQISFGRQLELFIVTETCQQQWTAQLPAGSKAYSVFPRAGGGVWATTGAPATLLEYDQAGQVVGSVGGLAAHPGVGLDFFTGFTRLANGNVVVANWLGHLAAPGEDTPHLVELTLSNELVWQWGTQTLARQIADVHVLR